MYTKFLCTILHIVALAYVGVMPAHCQALDLNQVLTGKGEPLTLQLKDLDSTWRVFTVSNSNAIATGLSGLGLDDVFTKGDTIAAGNDIYLVVYKADTVDVTSLLLPGGSAKPRQALTPESILRLSILNLHAISEIDGIHAFDMQAELAAGVSANDRITSMINAMHPVATPAPLSDATKPALLPTGAIAPDFTVRNVNGKPVKLSDFKGHIVVLEFWSTWCAPCQYSFPATNKLAARFASKNVVFLGVNVWDTAGAFKAWLPKHKELSSIRFSIDTSGQTGDVPALYKVTVIPTQYVVDMHGKVVTSIAGNASDDSELVTGIQMAISKK